jgi:hypothetical protein
MKINTIAKLSALVILASTMVSTASAAAYLKLGDIKGESQATADNDWIVIDSHTEEASRDADSGAIMQVIKIKRRTDVSSVALVRAFLDGTRFTGGVFVAAGDVSGDSVTETLPPFLITGYSQTTGGAEDGMEEFTFRLESTGEESALLLPAVQAAREAPYTDPDSDILPEPEPMAALLLPAVQKVREAASR